MTNAKAQMTNQIQNPTSFKIRSCDQHGFTLIEMVTAVAIFATVMIMATSIFQAVVESQRAAVSAQDAQESVRFAMEVMGKEIRTAQGDHTGSICDPEAPINFKTYNTSETGGVDFSAGKSVGDKLYFENKDGNCVIYELENGRLKITRGPAPTSLFITPDEVVVSNLEFTAINDPAGAVGTFPAFHALQGRVTMRMDVEAARGKEMHKQRMTIQTTVSSRFYE